MVVPVQKNKNHNSNQKENGTVLLHTDSRTYNFSLRITSHRYVEHAWDYCPITFHPGYLLDGKNNLPESSVFTTAITHAMSVMHVDSNKKKHANHGFTHFPTNPHGLFL